MYSLSHTSVFDDNDNYRYFGRTHNISADDSTESWIDKIARNKAPKLLNLDASSLECSSEVDEGESENWFESNHNASGDGSSSGQTGSSDSGKVKCGGRLLHIRELDRFIDNNDWSEKAEQNLLELKDWYFSDSGEPPPTD
jgi:hypothetical protein